MQDIVSVLEAWNNFMEDLIFLRSKDSSVVAELWVSENLHAFRFNCFSKGCPCALVPRQTQPLVENHNSIVCWTWHTIGYCLSWSGVLSLLLSHKEDKHSINIKDVRESHWGMCLTTKVWKDIQGRWYPLHCWRIVWTFVPPFRELESPEWGQGECRSVQNGDTDLPLSTMLGKEIWVYSSMAAALGSVHTPCSMWWLRLGHRLCFWRMNKRPKRIPKNLTPL